VFINVKRENRMKTVIALLSLMITTLAYAEPPKRIVTIGGALTEIVYALGEESRIVGNDTTSIYPQHASTLPKVGYQRALSAEGILSLNPDAIILTDEAGPPTVIRQLKSTGITVVQIKAGRSIADVKKSVDSIAKLLVREQAGALLIEKLDKDSEILTRVTQKMKSHKKVMFVLQHSGGAPMVAGTKTAADSIIKLSGGSNVVTGYQGYKPLTPEAAVALKPDVILITSQGLEQAGGKQKLMEAPGLSLTPAAKQGNVIALDSLLMLGFGPRTVEAASELNKAYDKL
jgi:iron complex transport system substrate-binding protein